MKNIILSVLFIIIFTIYSTVCFIEGHYVLFSIYALFIVLNAYRIIKEVK